MGGLGNGACGLLFEIGGWDVWGASVRLANRQACNLDILLLCFGVSCAVGGVFVMSLARYMMSVAFHQYDFDMRRCRPVKDWRLGTCGRWLAFARDLGSLSALNWDLWPAVIFCGGFCGACYGLWLCWLAYAR